MESQRPSACEIVPTIQNVISSVNLDHNLNLHRIKSQFRNAEYSPNLQSSVIMRMRNPMVTAMISASGRMVCTGAKSERESKIAARKFARIIQRLGYPVKFKDWKIQNIVATCDVKFPIRLEGLADANPRVARYESELFPGVRYSMNEPNVTLLVFSSGKVVITEAKSTEDLHKAFEIIYPALKEFKKVG